MSGFVVDASITTAWIIPDERSPQAITVRERLETENAHVPAIWPTEVGNALLIAERRGRLSAEEARIALSDLDNPAFVIDPPNPARTWIETTRLAREHRLTVYDASYLELAIRLALPLATFDKALGSAAISAGVALAS